VKRTISKVAAFLFLFSVTAAHAAHEYIDFDSKGNMVIAGPFNAIIPVPGDARVGKPMHTTESFLAEDLKVSKAGYFADDQFVIVQVETTNAAPGTLTNENLPTYKIGDRDFRARTQCIDISQEELYADDNALMEYVEDYNVQIVPAVQAVQLFVTTEDGTGVGTILYMRNVPDGCNGMSPEFETEFNDSFGRFIQSIQDRN
jgi:hypothetical protein